MGKCADCRFWQSEGVDDDKTYGDCKRYAPRPVLMGQIPDHWETSDFYAYWPSTTAEDGCGDFEGLKRRR